MNSVAYNLSENIGYCADYVSELSALLLYTHIGVAVTALLLSFFVLIRNRHSGIAWLLFCISLTFSGWAALNLAIWFGYDNSHLLMGAWSIIEIFSVLLFILSLCFVVTYIEKKPLSWWQILLIFVPILPVALFANTDSYLAGYDAQECVAIENELYIQYVRIIKIAYAIGIFGYLLLRTVQTSYASLRTEIAILAFGSISFIYSFMIAGFISEYTENFTYEIYGLFGMAVFIGTLSYLIVAFSAFNIKLVAAQALVTALALIVAAQAFFYSSGSELFIKMVTTVLVATFGFFLVRSVKREIKEKERNENLAKDLAKANKRLRELDKLKTEFVSIASHQLRSPLTAIRGYASMIVDGDYGTVPEKIIEPLRRIDESSHFMASSIDDFLNVSRIESGSMKYEMTMISLKEEASKVVDELRAEAVKKGLVLMYRSTTETDTHVNADVGKLHQVLHNLIDNAMKYTPNGQITVVAHDNPALKKAYISVVDTGIGMNPETAGSIFDKFVRAKNANTVNVFGTGLGLYIARQMIEAMGGTITPSSEGEGKGSTFKIELPLAD